MLSIWTSQKFCHLLKKYGKDLCPYSLTILRNVLGLVLQIFLYLAVFDCSTPSNWLNHMV